MADRYDQTAHAEVQQTNEYVELPRESPKFQHITMINSETAAVGVHFRERLRTFDSSIQCPCGCRQMLKREVLDYQWETTTSPIGFPGIVGYHCKKCNLTYVPSDEKIEMQSAVNVMMTPVGRVSAAGRTRHKDSTDRTFHKYK